MPEWLTRTEALIGREAVRTLGEKSVAVLGLGGVGGACAEALCRGGIGTLILIDRDTVAPTDLNRQLLATAETLGLEKTEAARRRFASINPDCRILPLAEFYLPENREILFSHPLDFVVDAVDTVTAKLDLIEACAARGVPLISCMGTGNRLDPARFVIGDIADTAGCGDGLARVIRRELRRRGIPGQTVLYSTEPPRPVVVPGGEEHGRHPPASVSFVPPVAGYLLAGHVLRQLVGTGAG